MWEYAHSIWVILGNYLRMSHILNCSWERTSHQCPYLRHLGWTRDKRTDELPSGDLWKCIWSEWMKCTPFPIGYKLSIFESFKLFKICWCNNEIKFFCSLTFFAATNVRCRTSLWTSRRNNLDAILRIYQLFNILTPCFNYV